MITTTLPTLLTYVLIKSHTIPSPIYIYMFIYILLLEIRENLQIVINLVGENDQKLDKVRYSHRINGETDLNGTK